MIFTDGVNSVTPEIVAQSAIRIIDAIQDEQPATQIHGLASCFLAMCRVLEINPRELLEKSERVRLDTTYEEKRTLQAIDDYIRGELL